MPDFSVTRTVPADVSLDGARAHGVPLSVHGWLVRKDLGGVYYVSEAPLVQCDKRGNFARIYYRVGKNKLKAEAFFPSEADAMRAMIGRLEYLHERSLGLARKHERQLSRAIGDLRLALLREAKQHEPHATTEGSTV